MILLYSLIFFASCFLLVKTGIWLARSAGRISDYLNWSESVKTFLTLAFIASLPEIFIGLSSAFHSSAQISFGNIFGTNILNLSLGISLVVLLGNTPLNIGRQAKKENCGFVVFLSLLPILLILDKKMSRIDGIILLLAFIFYIQIILRNKNLLKKKAENKEKQKIEYGNFLKDFSVLLGSLVLLLLSGEGIVRSVNFAAAEMGIPLVVAGAIFVTAGTALPEIIFGIRAKFIKRRREVLVNFLNFAAVGFSLVLGVASLISPFEIVNFSPYLINILFLFIIGAALFIFSKTNKKISRREAYILIALYLIFISAQLLI